MGLAPDCGEQARWGRFLNRPFMGLPARPRGCTCRPSIAAHSLHRRPLQPAGSTSVRTSSDNSRRRLHLNPCCRTGWCCKAIKPLVELELDSRESTQEECLTCKRNVWPEGDEFLFVHNNCCNNDHKPHFICFFPITAFYVLSPDIMQFNRHVRFSVALQ